MEAAALAYFGHTARAPEPRGDRHAARGAAEPQRAASPRRRTRRACRRRATRWRAGCWRRARCRWGRRTPARRPEAVLAEVRATPVPERADALPPRGAARGGVAARAAPGAGAAAHHAGGGQPAARGAADARSAAGALGAQGIHNGAAVVVEHAHAVRCARWWATSTSSTRARRPDPGLRHAALAGLRAQAAPLRDGHRPGARGPRAAGARRRRPPTAPTPRATSTGASRAWCGWRTRSRSRSTCPSCGCCSSWAWSASSARCGARAWTSLAPEPGHYGLSAAVGGIELTPLELAAVYAALAQDGRARPLRVLDEGRPPRPEPRSCSRPGAAWLTRRALSLQGPAGLPRAPRASPGCRRGCTGRRARASATATRGRRARGPSTPRWCGWATSTTRPACTWWARRPRGRCSSTCWRRWGRAAACDAEGAARRGPHPGGGVRVLGPPADGPGCTRAQGRAARCAATCPRRAAPTTSEVEVDAATRAARSRPPCRDGRETEQRVYLTLAGEHPALARRAAPAAARAARLRAGLRAAGASGRAAGDHLARGRARWRCCIPGVTRGCSRRCRWRPRSREAAAS